MDPKPALAPILSPRGAVAAAIGLILLFALADGLTGNDASLTLLYGAAIALATWYASRRWGLALSFLAAFASAAADAFLAPAAEQGCAVAPHSPGTVAWNVAVQIGTFHLFAFLVDALRRRLDRERTDARTDPLTALANRRAFLEAATLELERSRRHGRPLSLAYVDLDDFKGVNDRRGHAEGDALLVAVARTLRAGTRSFDLVARLGGDEFGLLLPETDAAAVAPFLARLRGQLEAAMRYHGWNVGFSAGVVTWTRPPESVGEMIQRADALMYAAKAAGKGATRFETADGAARAEA